MKNKILELRKNGKSYNEICKILDCSKSTVSYYCGENQKIKTRKRNQKNRIQHCIGNKVCDFKRKLKSTRKTKDPKSTNSVLTCSKVCDFQRRVGNKKEKCQLDFRYDAVLEKFGQMTQCYLTGDPIDLKEPKTYHFDHIVPATRGGDNSLQNLGITTKTANQAKGDLTVSELLCLCEKILRNHGYNVQKQ